MFITLVFTCALFSYVCVTECVYLHWLGSPCGYLITAQKGKNTHTHTLASEILTCRSLTTTNTSNHVGLDWLSVPIATKLNSLFLCLKQRKVKIQAFHEFYFTFTFACRSNESGEVTKRKEIEMPTELWQVELEKCLILYKVS